MNSKWYIGLLIIALAFLGISSQQTVLPNQEIVVQFHLDAVSENEAERAISVVTKQLQSIGVEGVQTTQTLDGNLKITYFSTIDVAVVKDLFSRQANVLAGGTSLPDSDNSPNQPFDKDTANYQLNVSEIQTATDADMGLNGILVDAKSGNEWYVNPVLYLGNANLDFSLQNINEKIAYTLYGGVALGIDTSSYKIPEVRAGPLS
tara:strand:- start:10132 stop:10746 length:615 start_codon:yes stop_codon:yes gene_type:complete